jgi:hypothetical protein
MATMITVKKHNLMMNTTHANQATDNNDSAYKHIRQLGETYDNPKQI